jgi:hypothetical protein
MTRYFFHVIDGRFLVDDVGTELPDMGAVRAMAVQASGEILRDLGIDAWTGSEWQMHVTDDAKRTVLKLRFSAEDLTMPDTLDEPADALAEGRQAWLGLNDPISRSYSASGTP